MGNGPNIRSQGLSEAIRNADDGTTLAGIDTHLETIFEDTSEANNDSLGNSKDSGYFEAAVEFV